MRDRGIDYLDLAGEVQFIQDSIDGYHDVAARTDTRIVHCCGFDSIPSDLAVLLLHQAVPADGAGRPGGHDAGREGGQGRFQRRDAGFGQATAGRGGRRARSVARWSTTRMRSVPSARPNQSSATGVICRGSSTTTISG